MEKDILVEIMAVLMERRNELKEKYERLLEIDNASDEMRIYKSQTYGRIREIGVTLNTIDLLRRSEK